MFFKRKHKEEDRRMRIKEILKKAVRFNEGYIEWKDYEEIKYNKDLLYKLQHSDFEPAINLVAKE